MKQGDIKTNVRLNLIQINRFYHKKTINIIET